MPRKKIQDHPELFDVLEVRKLWQTEGLFSDHYLKVRLSKNDWWPADDTVRPVWEFCRDLYERRAFALRRFDNEMGMRQEFIDKILGRLGFAWSDNLRLPETNQDMEPDYLLYENEEANHVNAYEIDGMPMPRIAFTTSAAKRAALLAKAQPLYERIAVTGDSADVLAFVDEQLRARPERTDVVHDLLAFLAGRMMDLNQSQRAAARQFLADLKDFHGIDAHTLTPKTKLDEFWKLETAEVFAHVGKNRKALAAAKVDLNEAAEEKIRSRFEQSKAAILPMDSQITFTDELIDQIVYRLYGLTPDEIELVEETGK